MSEIDDLIKKIGNPIEIDPPKNFSDRIWVTKDHRSMKIGDMVDQHLKNAVAYLARKYNPAHSDDAKDIKFMDSLDQKNPTLKKFLDVIGHNRAMAHNKKYPLIWAEAKKRGLI